MMSYTWLRPLSWVHVWLMALLAILVALNGLETVRQYLALATDPADTLRAAFTDFKTFWACTRLWAEGKDPYDQALVARFLENTGWLEPGRYNLFLYPPAGLYVLGPFGQLGFEQAVGVAVLLSVSTLGLALYRWRQYAQGWAGAGLGTLYLLVGPWHTANVMQGQVLNCVAAAGLALLVALPSAQVIVGIGLGVLIAAKPSLALLVGVVALLTRRLWALGWAVGAATLVGVAAAAFSPQAETGYAATMASLPHWYLPWHGTVSDFAVYTNQSLNALAACLDKGLALQLDGTSYTVLGDALRILLYTTLSGLGGLTLYLLLGQGIRALGRQPRLGGLEVRFADQSLAFRASLALTGVYLLEPVSWIAYTLFIAPALVLLALESRGRQRTVVLAVLAVLCFRLNYFDNDLVRRLADRGGVWSMAELAGIELYRASIGLALLGLWLYLAGSLLPVAHRERKPSLAV